MGLLVGPWNSSQLFFLFRHVSLTNPQFYPPAATSGVWSRVRPDTESFFPGWYRTSHAFSQPAAKVNAGILILICQTGLFPWMVNGFTEKQKLDMACHVLLDFVQQNLSTMWNAWIVTNGLAKSIKSLPVEFGRDTCGHTKDYVRGGSRLKSLSCSFQQSQIHHSMHL